MIDASKVTPSQATEAVVGWLRAHELKILNVVGPRASGWPRGYDYVLQTIKELLQA